MCTHTRSLGQYAITNEPKMHIFGWWQEAGTFLFMMLEPGLKPGTEMQKITEQQSEDGCM